MNASGIRRSILDIYERYRIPIHLRMHMVRVAGVVSLVLSRWNGPRVDAEVCVAAALVHDLGNMVKIRIDRSENVALFSSYPEGLQYWKRVHDEAVARYGCDDARATLAMLDELDVEDAVVSLVNVHGIDGVENVMRNGSFEAKILVFADHRVAPHGIVSLDERCRDALVRYGSVFPYARFLAVGREIGEQVLAHTDLVQEELGDAVVEPQMREFRYLL